MSEITDEMVEAAMPAYEGLSGSVATAEDHVRSIVQAALAARPAPEAGSVVGNALTLAENAMKGRGQYHVLEAAIQKLVEAVNVQAAAIAEREERIRQVEQRLSTAYRVKTECNDEANFQRARAEHLKKALLPFSEMAGEVFARNWNRSRIVLALDNPDDPHRITAGDLFDARAALQQEGESDDR